MRAVLYLAAIVFIMGGAAMAAAPFLWPMSVALGIGIAQGLAVMLGGFLLLGLAAILGAVRSIATVAVPQRGAQPRLLPDTPVAPQSAAPPEKDATSDNEPRVMAEGVIEGHRARILSDGSIEAELEQGWLRFDNEQHLRDYLRELGRLRQQGMV